MSHVSTYTIKVTDIDLMAKVATDLGCSVRFNVTVDLYGRNKVEHATAIKIPGWNYEVAVTEEGEIKYDFFGSQHGEGIFERLGEILQETDRRAVTRLIGTEFYTQEEMEDKSIQISVMLD